MEKHYSIDIYGLVQGVGFRYSTFRYAKKYDIVGSVQNCPDGHVHVEAQGLVHPLEQFIHHLQEGPNSFAQVHQFKISEQPLANYTTFTVA